MTATVETATRRGVRDWVALAVLMLPVLLVSVDNTILNFALPAIARELEPSSTEQLWIIDAYSLVLAGLLVTMGSLGDRVGRRRLLLIGAVGFTAVSALAVFAPTAGWLIAARAAMGLFGATLMPATMSLLRSIFPDRDRRRIAVAIWAGAFSAGAALGPIIGGFLIEHFAWQSVFLLAVPVLLTMLALLPFLVGESRDPHPGPIDLPSIVLSMLALAPVAYGIKEAAVHGWGGVLPILAGVAFAVVFVRRQRRLAHPMLDMTLFRRPAFSGSLLVNLCSVIALVGFLYFVSQHLQLVVGLEPMAAGLALVPGMAASILGGLLVTPIARRVSAAIVVPTALVLALLGYLLVAVAGTHDLALLVIAFAVLGAGIGAAETVSGELILANAPAAKAGAASAVSETAYELGAVLGTALLGGILTAWYRTALVVPADVSAELAAHAEQTLAGAMNAADDLGGALGASLRAAAAAAFEGGVTTTSLIGAGLVVLAALIAATTLRGSRQAPHE